MRIRQTNRGKKEEVLKIEGTIEGLSTKGHLKLSIMSIWLFINRYLSKSRDSIYEALSATAFRLITPGTLFFLANPGYFVISH
jgi:hypothetical protein